MIEFASGFLLSMSLIVAIGPQNAFVLRQGLLRQDVFWVALTCAMSDAILIAAGVAGLGALASAQPELEIAMRYGGEYCQLEELVVDPSARGKNVGGLLMQAVLDQARARGCAEMGLYLVETTEQNRPFYEKFGFQVVGSEMRQALT